LAGLLVAWLVVKLVFVHVVIPIRNENRAPREKGQKIAFLVPPEQTLYLYGLKDEGLMFYYSRCHPKGENDRLVRRLKGLNALPSSSEPVYCILTEREWQNWDRGREGEVIFYLTDQQNDPIVLLRVKPKSETLIRSRERSVNRGTQSRSTSLSYADEKYGYLIPS
jgi:hypothetical protein